MVHYRKVGIFGQISDYDFFGLLETGSCAHRISVVCLTPHCRITFQQINYVLIIQDVKFCLTWYKKSTVLPH